MEASDGKKLYGRQWDPDEPVAVVCLVHGLGEHVGRFDHVATHLRDVGIAVFGIDQRGHGHNSGSKGHARCQNLWDDIESLMKHARLLYLDLPMFLYGHSWGGNIVSNFLLRRNSSELRGAILSSPWIKLSFEPTRFEMIMAKWMSRVYPGFTQSNGLKIEHLSRDPSVGEAYLNDPLVHDKVSAGLFTDAYNNGLYALEHAGQLTIPILITHGTDDGITSSKASETFAQSALNATMKLWPEMRHETHNEYGKEEVIDYIARWLLNLIV